MSDTRIEWCDKTADTLLPLIKTYVVNLYGGRVGLIEAESLGEAKNNAYREQGTTNVQSVQLATEDDIQWHRSMSGWGKEGATK